MRSAFSTEKTLGRRVALDIARSAHAAEEVALCHKPLGLFAGMLAALIRVMQQRIRLVDQADPSHAAISLLKVSITLNSDHTQPLVV
jgi:hypothetical protein